MKNGLRLLALASLALLFAVGTARAGQAKAGDPVDTTNCVTSPAAGGPGLIGSDPGLSWQAATDSNGNTIAVLADSTNAMWDTPAGEAAYNWYKDDKYGGAVGLPGDDVRDFGPDIMPASFPWTLPNGDRPNEYYPDVEVDVDSSSYSLASICGNLPGASVVKQGVAGKDFCQITYAGQVFPVVFNVTNGAIAASSITRFPESIHSR